MFVNVLEYTTENPLTHIGLCAGLSTNKGYQSEETIMSQLDRKKAVNRAIDCFNKGHMSVFEHVTVTFSIHGISRACANQLVRHRHVAFTQESQRYVTYDVDKLEFVTPPSIFEAHFTKEGPAAEAERVYDEALEVARRAYAKLLEYGLKAEDIRYILPNATTTNIVATMNLNGFAYFYKVRSDKSAQWEIRQLANEMLNSLSELPGEEWKRYAELVRMQNA